MIKVPVHPMFKYLSKPVHLLLDGMEHAHFHFIDKNDNHITGFSLFTIDDRGVKLDIGMGRSLFKEMDLDRNNRDQLKITGVDLL
jgi:hypothetical protein